MYIPAHFLETRPEALQRIMREHPLGMLVTHASVGLDADHIPFEFDAGAGEHGALIAHVARANTLWQRCPTGTPVMVVFRGAEAYISPNWYPSKHETHRQVPTWNYEVVQAHGTLTVHDDARFVRRVVAQLTRRHEATEAKPWKMGDSEPAFIDIRVIRLSNDKVVRRMNGWSRAGRSATVWDGDKDDGGGCRLGAGHGRMAPLGVAGHHHCGDLLAGRGRL